MTHPFGEFERPFEEDVVKNAISSLTDTGEAILIYDLNPGLPFDSLKANLESVGNNLRCFFFAKIRLSNGSYQLTANDLKPHLPDNSKSMSIGEEILVVRLNSGLRLVAGFKAEQESTKDTYELFLGNGLRYDMGKGTIIEQEAAAFLDEGERNDFIDDFYKLTTTMTTSMRLDNKMVPGDETLRRMYDAD